jgi:hypothetical protein
VPFFDNLKLIVLFIRYIQCNLVLWYCSPTCQLFLCLHVLSLSYWVCFVFKVFCCLPWLSICLCSLQVLHQQWIWKRFTLILENNVLFIQRRRGLFANFHTLPRKHFDIMSRVVVMAPKLKFLLLLRNGGGMCGCPFSLIIIINFFIRIYFL